jgi:hypothetical protein
MGNGWWSDDCVKSIRFITVFSFFVFINPKIDSSNCGCACCAEAEGMPTTELRSMCYGVSSVRSEEGG